MNEDILPEGYDLYIDKTVTDICEKSNVTSNNTGKALYILVIMSILSFTCVLDTLPGNWQKARIHSAERDFVESVNKSYDCKRTIDSLVKVNSIALMGTINQLKKDSAILNRKSELSKDKLNNLRRTYFERVQLVSIPTLGYHFDVNHLSIICGVTYLILLIILYSFLIKKIDNLNIAFRYITKRYTDRSQYKFLRSEFERNYDFTPSMEDADNIAHGVSPEVLIEEKDSIKKMDGLISTLNLRRRRYHYSYLTMNEVFTGMFIQNVNSEAKTITDKSGQISYQIKRFSLNAYSAFSSTMYWTPFITFLLIVVNDLVTIPYFLYDNLEEKLYNNNDVLKSLYTDVIVNGFKFSEVNKNMKTLLVIEVVFLISILLFTIVCHRKNVKVRNMYNDFLKNGYKVNEQKA